MGLSDWLTINDIILAVPVFLMTFIGIQLIVSFFEFKSKIRPGIVDFEEVVKYGEFYDSELGKIKVMVVRYEGDEGENFPPCFSFIPGKEIYIQENYMNKYFDECLKVEICNIRNLYGKDFSEISTTTVFLTDFYCNYIGHRFESNKKVEWLYPINQFD